MFHAMFHDKKNIIAELTKEVSNRKKTDKFAISYYIQVMDFHNFYSMCYNEVKRDAYLQMFITLIEDDCKLIRLAKMNTLKHIFNN